MISTVPPERVHVVITSRPGHVFRGASLAVDVFEDETAANDLAERINHFTCATGCTARVYSDRRVILKGETNA